MKQLSLIRYKGVDLKDIYISMLTDTPMGQNHRAGYNLQEQNFPWISKALKALQGLF